MITEAEKTTARVLHWALDPNGPPPEGSWDGLEALMTPHGELCAALGRLAAVTAARLALNSPPLGEDTPLDASTLWLAAAMANSDSPKAVEIVRACPPAQSMWDLITRHGLVAPLLQRHGSARVEIELAEALLMASPLTGLFLAPAPGQEDQLSSLALKLAAHRDGRNMLAAQFCLPLHEPAILNWRGFLLDRLRLHTQEGLPLMLNTFEMAITHHGDEWREGLNEAHSILDNPLAPKEKMQWALAVGLWWQPLRAFRKANIKTLRQRSYMDFFLYLQGVKLASIVATLTGKE